MEGAAAVAVAPRAARDAGSALLNASNRPCAVISTSQLGGNYRGRTYSQAQDSLRAGWDIRNAASTTQHSSPPDTVDCPAAAVNRKSGVLVEEQMEQPVGFR